MSAPHDHDIDHDTTRLDGLPPAMESAPLAVPGSFPPAPVSPGAATPQSDTTRDTDDTDDATSGVPVGQMAAGGTSLVTVAGTVLYQTAGVIGLAAGGVITAAAGVAYVRHRMGAAKGDKGGRGRTEKTRTVKTVQSALRSPGTGGGLLGGRGRTATAGRSTSSRLPGLGRASTGGRQGGKALWPSSSRTGSAGGSAPARPVLGRAAAAVRPSTSRSKANKATASDGGGALKIPAARKDAKTSAAKSGETTPVAKSAAAKETPKKAGKETTTTTPVATKKKGASSTPTSRFSRWASWWAEDQPGPISSRTARLARRLDEAAYGRSGVWGRVLGWLFGWRHEDDEGQDQAADGTTEQEQAPAEQQKTTDPAPAPAAPAAEQAPQQTTDGPAAQRSQRRAADTNTRNNRRFHMSGSPLVIASAEMAAAAAGYAPENMWVVARDLDTLGEMPVNVATAVRVYTTRMEGEYPLHESVTEMLRQLHDGLAMLGALADEIAVQFRNVHAEDIKRDEAPRTNEQLWNV